MIEQGQIRRRINQALSRVTGYELRRSSADTPPQRPPVHPLGSRRRTAPLPPARLPRRQARSARFFDDYPRFFSTSQTTAQPVRLNLRHDAIIGQHRDLFDGARVLDLASHDGRWSFAALQAGASSVIGIEGRRDLVDAANDTFDRYGVETGRYRFIAGDIFEVLEQESFDVDLVLCLGFLYHTLRYNELLAHIANCRPSALIIDTRINVSDEPVVYIRTEPWAAQRNAIADAYTRGDRVLTGRPSKRAVETMVEAYGFDVDGYSDWAALLRHNDTDDSVDVYRKGQRVTMRCVARRSPNQ